jgi:DNA-3-methyladenine glycosylase II
MHANQNRSSVELALMPSHVINDQSDLDVALAALIKADLRLHALVDRAGRPSLRRRPAGFSGLCAIVCAQQLSSASAGAIWGRLTAAFDPFDHDALRRTRPSKLAKLGLSRPKIKTMKALAVSIDKGAIDLHALAEMPADDARAALMALHGIGPWTADVYLLFCLGHADAWPAGDLALQEAARIALELKSRPNARDMIELAQPWRPWRGVAAHLLWTYYRAIKRRDPVPIPADTKGAADAG